MREGEEQTNIRMSEGGREGGSQYLKLGKKARKLILG